MNSRVPKIIGLHGEIGSGKDTVASYLGLFFGFKVLGFSDPVYESLYRLNPYIPIGQKQYVSLQVIVDKLGWDVAKRRYLEIRRMLRVIGTENGREVHGEDCWIDIAQQRMQQSGAQRFVFRDVRFPGEAAYIYNNGGEVWQLLGRVSPEVADLPPHVSEGNRIPVTRTLHNDQSIPVLHRRINHIMEGYLE